MKSEAFLVCNIIIVSAKLFNYFERFIHEIRTLPYVSFANKMAPGASEWIFHAEHESGFKNFPSRHIFEKIGVANP